MWGACHDYLSLVSCSYSLVIALVAVQLPVVIGHDVTRQGHVTHLAHVTHYAPSLFWPQLICPWISYLTVETLGMEGGSGYFQNVPFKIVTASLALSKLLLNTAMMCYNISLFCVNEIAWSSYACYEKWHKVLLTLDLYYFWCVPCSPGDTGCGCWCQCSTGRQSACRSQRTSSSCSK